MIYVCTPSSLYKLVFSSCDANYCTVQYMTSEENLTKKENPYTLPIKLLLVLCKTTGCLLMHQTLAVHFKWTQCYVQ